MAYPSQCDNKLEKTLTKAANYVSYFYLGPPMILELVNIENNWWKWVSIIVECLWLFSIEGCTIWKCAVLTIIKTWLEWNIHCRYLELWNACLNSLVFIALNVRYRTESKFPSIVFLSINTGTAIPKPFGRQSIAFIITTKNRMLKCTYFENIYNQQHLKHDSRWYFCQAHFVLFVLQPK